LIQETFDENAHNSELLATITAQKKLKQILSRNL